MAEIVVKLPEDLEYLSKMNETDFSLFVNRIVRERLERIARLESALKKSKFSEQDVKIFSEKINKELSEKYVELYGR